MPCIGSENIVDGRAMKKLVFASLFNEISKPAFVRLKPFIKSIRTVVYFLYVNTPENFIDTGKAEERMSEYAYGQEELLIHRHIYNHEEVEKGIIAFAEKKGRNHSYRFQPSEIKFCLPNWSYRYSLI